MMELALPVRSVRTRLRYGCAASALLGVATSLALGVALPRPAAAQTKLPTTAAPVYLQRYGTGNPFTVTAGTVIAPSSGAAMAIYGDSSVSWTLTNNGTVRGGSAAAVQLQSTSAVSNDGTIRSAAGTGIYLTDGGAVTNQASGRIGGYIAGITITGAAGTVLNDGTIRSSAGRAVYLRAGSVTNAAGAAIIGRAIGIDVGYGASTVTNAGSITGTTRYGVVLGGGGIVTNQTGGMITGGRTGVVLAYGGTVMNAGGITGKRSDGIDLGGGGLVTNAAGGVITGAAAGINALYPATVMNAGAIAGTTQYGVLLKGGGLVANLAGGAITGGIVGVALTGGGTVTNAGSITGGTASVAFAGTGANLLTLQTGSVLNGTAFGSTAAGATNALVLQGTGMASNSFVNFNTLAVEASGAWTLGGTSTIGATVVSSGTLVVTGALTSAFTVAGGGTLQGTSASLLARGAISDNGVLVFDQAATGTVAAGITGSGSLVKQNAGTLTLSGANSFSGGVTVNGGTLVLGSATGFGSGGLTVNGGTADVSGFATTLTALAGSGGTVALGSQALTLNQSTTTSFAGALTGSGSLVKAGSGTLVLNGVCAIGSTTIAGGTLEIGDVGHAGAELTSAVTIDAGGVLAAFGTVAGSVTSNSGGTVMNAGAIAGTGPDGVALNAGAVVANAAGGTITGAAAGISGSGTVLNAGAITGATGVAFTQGGAVTNQAGGAITGAGAAVSVTGGSGAVTNAGMIAAAGAGSTGVQLDAGGSVTNAAGGSIAGARYGIVIAGGGTLTNAGTISGAGGAVVFTGPGASLLTLQTGSLLNGNILGSTAAGATNALALQGTGVLNSNILAFQTLDVAASGVWTLNGASAIAQTTIDSGTLMVGDHAHPGARLTGSVVVDPGGTLAGHGTIIGAVTNRGVVSPGGSIGTLVITGNFVQTASGILSIEVSPTASSQLAITGSASIGGTLVFAPDPGIYRKGTQYNFLTAAGGASGGFTAVDPGGLAITVGDAAGGFGAAVTNSSFVGSSATPNEQAIGNALATAPGTGDANTLVTTVNAQAPAAPQNTALDELGGEAYADFKSVARSGIRDFLWSMSDRPANSGAPGTVAATAGTPIPSPPALASWGTAYGHVSSLGGDGNAHGYSGSSGGGTAGLEHAFPDAVTAGLALGYGHSDFSLTGLGQSGGLDQTALGAYGEKRWGMWFLDGAAALAYDHGDATRQIAFLGRAAGGGFDGFAGGVAAKAGARVALTPLVALEPSAALVWSHVAHSGFSESGANAADLAVSATSEDKGQAILAARLVQHAAAGSGVVTPELSLGWAHELNDPRTTIDESFAAIPGSGFSLTGAGTGRDLALVGFGISYATTQRLALYARYDGALGQHVADHAASAGVTLSW
ncbi:MAG: autotransporter domain-containing protein [Stellaceae bacterium]